MRGMGKTTRNTLWFQPEMQYATGKKPTGFKHSELRQPYYPCMPSVDSIECNEFHTGPLTPWGVRGAPNTVGWHPEDGWDALGGV